MAQSRSVSARPPPKVTVTIHRNAGKGATATKTVSVTRPRNERTLATAYNKVLTTLAPTGGDRFDDAGLARQMAKAATGQTRSITLRAAGPKGTPIATVPVSRSLSKTMSDVIGAVERRMDADLVYEDDLGKQLAALAATAKTNQP